jgi:S-DNA-T family DNA segregation ATPase FtsK/SpoIIIE
LPNFLLRFLSGLSPELKYELIGIVLFTAATLSFISLAGYNTGPVGRLTAKTLNYSFGIGSLVVPTAFLMISLRYLWKHNEIKYTVKFYGLIFIYILSLAIYHHFKVPAGQEVMPENLVPGGGLVGGFTLFILRKFFGIDGTIIVLIASTLSAILLVTTWSIAKTMLFAKEKAADTLTSAREAIACTSEIAENFMEAAARKCHFYDQERDRSFVTSYDIPMPPTVAAEQQEPEPSPQAQKEPRATSEQSAPVSSPLEKSGPVVPVAYKIPPLTLLKKYSKPNSARLNKEISDNARILEETLENFGVSARIINTSQGPTVTRYELEPAPGVKVSRIVNLSDDISLKLAAPGIRIEAPIPGKAAIGIEVPNKEVSMVPLRDVLDSNEFQTASSRLMVGLGKDIAGKPILADLSKMPHLLVAGATGSGKSVCINTIITSILCKATPEEIKLVLIDPKVVELSNYNGIPHLLTPVVTDAKKAASALRWAVQEMERRYNCFAATGVRDITRYNEVSGERLPLILIIIDELADLMMIAPVDVEDAICRLAQMARAAGLHLILATQRPSVDVITGTIKANVPSRISFAVSSQIDSRTILDMAGAEKLLGKGDMLFYPVGAAKPLRVQGAFIGDSEVEELVSYINKQAEPEYVEGVTNCEEAAERQEDDKFEDELLEDAVRMVLETGQASVSMLQRKFRVGYTRAARLIDTMEEMKIVGPNIGSKAREILMTSDQVYARYFKK